MSYIEQSTELLAYSPDVDKIAVIDDFRTLTTVAHGKSKKTTGRQDKGHKTEVQVFAQALKQGSPSPISWQDQKAVTLASLLAVRSLREGQPFDIS